MSKNFLKLNAEKTEVLIVHRPGPTALYVPSSISLFNNTVACCKSARNLGVIFDEQLNLNDHISSVCKKAFYQIHLISKVRKYLTEDAAKTLVQCNVMTILDYCNVLLSGLPAAQINRLQRVQNCAARVIKNLQRKNHITPAMKDLHWLPIKYRICYKVNTLTHRAIHHQGPLYIQELISQYAPSRNLRSANTNLLNIPKSNLKTIGERAFSIQAPLLWNALPCELRSTDNYYHFKKLLKTHYFKISYA